MCNSNYMAIAMSFLLAISLAALPSNILPSVLASQSQSYCPPICLDEVRQHVNDAKEALEDGNLVVVKGELDIVDSLLDQLKDMTSASD